MRSSGCALCGHTPGVGERLCPRRLVPQSLFDHGAFEIDPLGSAGATVLVCASCREALASPMLLTEDVSRFADALSLHREQHGAHDSGVTSRLLHRAIHLGLRAVYGELSERPAAPSPRPEPAQLDLFSSKVARLADVEEALERGAFPLAIVRCKAAKDGAVVEEARFLAQRLATVEKKLVQSANDRGALERMAKRVSALIDGARLSPSIARAFERGLHRRIAESIGVGEGPAVK